MSDEVKLQPCPFCGGPAYISQTMGRMYISAHHTKECQVTPSTWVTGCTSLDEHIRAWNSRMDNENNQKINKKRR